MKIGVQPETVLERLALATGQVPLPIAHALGGVLLARTVMVATQLGVFEVLQAQMRTAGEIAVTCGSEPSATQKLLDALVSLGYLSRHKATYRLTVLSRKWLLKDSPTSLYDAILYVCVEWRWLTQLDVFIQTGQPLDFHATMTPDEWGLYQRGMRAIAGLAAREVARHVPVPTPARTMLDIGGGHGYYAVALCRRHRRLHATILDLPAAIAHAAPILAREGMGDRVIHRAGDARVANLGRAAYDLVFIAQFVHHFDAATNRALVRRVARALRPGGFLVLLDALGSPTSGAGGQMAGLLDLYFAFTSRAGTWSFDELARWQRDAGLVPLRPMRFLKLPGFGAQAALKPMGASAG